MRIFRAFGVTFIGLAGWMLIPGCSSDEGKPKAVDPFGQGGSGGSDADASTGGSAGAGATGGSSGGGSAGEAGSGGAGGSGGADAALDQATDSDAPAPLPEHCSNGLQDDEPGETDIDCGGPCAGCATGQFCGIANDCLSLRCDPTTKRCLAASCVDGTKNGNETDRDCGGSTCPPCDDGKDCTVAADCRSGVCGGNPTTCQVPSCTDNVRNGAESDVDCGEACPAKCPRGQRCSKDADCANGECNTGQGSCECPTGMVIMTRPGVAGGNYCIDEHEVTYDEYNLFWQASVSVDTQDEPCKSTNNTFTPSQDWPPIPAEMPFPVAYADWCDAAAYCKWGNKRLCGNITGGPGSIATGNDHLSSQWFNACTAQDANTYPYGSVYEPSTCAGADFACEITDASACTAGAVKKTLPANRGTSITPAPCWQGAISCTNFCQGGATGLLDMSGNVEEWTDECDSGGCLVRGGSYLDGAGADGGAEAPGLRCDTQKTRPRATQSENLGFRCCLD